MRIMVAGDWHGNKGFVEAFYDRWVSKMDVEAVVQVGDFGFWENGRGGPEFLDAVNACSVKHNVDTYWIDGNHEDHELLRSRYIQDQVDDFVEIRDHVFHIPRGLAWEWDGVKFMGFGGAYSPNKAQLTPYINWFPQEMAFDEEIDRAATRGTVDVLFSHDVPEGVQFMNEVFAGTVPIMGAMWSRRHMLRVAEAAQPTMIVHGHYHFHYKEFWNAPWGEVFVIGLDADMSAQHWGDVYTVLDTKYPTW
jgi:Icc-related predicted phosphoesterase